MARVGEAWYVYGIMEGNVWGYDDCYLLGYSAVYSVESQPTFHKSRDLLATCFHASILLGLFFDREDGGYMFLRKVG
jgi:hypothetical protein